VAYENNKGAPKLLEPAGKATKAHNCTFRTGYMITGTDDLSAPYKAIAA
jgi:hypothetical protein